MPLSCLTSTSQAPESAQRKITPPTRLLILNFWCLCEVVSFGRTRAWQASAARGWNLSCSTLAKSCLCMQRTFRQFLIKQKAIISACQRQWLGRMGAEAAGTQWSRRTTKCCRKIKKASSLYKPLTKPTHICFCVCVCVCGQWQLALSRWQHFTAVRKKSNTKVSARV